MLVSALQVYFRDVKNFLPYFLRVWLYSSPVLYYADEVPEGLEWILVVNPLGGLLTAWSDVIIAGADARAVARSASPPRGRSGSSSPAGCSSSPGSVSSLSGSEPAASASRTCR